MSAPTLPLKGPHLIDIESEDEYDDAHMEEVFAQILLALAEIFFEVFLEIAGEALLDLITRAASDVLRPTRPRRPIITIVACVFLGALAGTATLTIFPHPLFHPSKVRGISLLISPILTGMFMSAVGSILRRHGKRVVQIESFPYAFAFAFGMSLVRLLGAN
jgi:hypothetical protein